MASACCCWSRVTPERVAETCVILDGVQDAGNVGSVLRSAAAGIKRVFCGPGTAYAWSSKVLRRSGMGAHFLLDIFGDVEPADLIACLNALVTITDSHGATAIYDCDLSGALAWAFGNEGAGVSQVWRDAVRQRVTILQPGGIESLKVAAAATVCLSSAVSSVKVLAVVCLSLSCKALLFSCLICSSRLPSVLGGDYCLESPNTRNAFHFHEQKKPARTSVIGGRPLRLDLLQDRSSDLLDRLMRRRKAT